MTKRALIYAWTTVAVGTTVLACAALQWQSSNAAAFMVCLGLAVFASTFKVKLPKLTCTVSPGFVFTLVAVATRSWSETVAIAAVCGLVQCLWRPKTRPGALQVAFNTATLAIAGGMAHAVPRGLTVMGGADVLVVVLGAAGVTLLVSNTLMVSAILCLLNQAPIYAVWRSVQLWTAPYYLAGGVLASVWARTELSATAGITILAAASVYLLSVCYHELSSIASQRTSCA